MKKTLTAFAILFAFTVNVHAQQIFNEVKNMQKNFYNIKYDTSKSMDERRVASFKWDAIQYMLYKSNDETSFTEQQLGEQTLYMTEFVNLYFKRLAEANSKSKKNIVVARFKNASINNSLFNDMDKELVLGWVNNTKFATPFSLDTNWKKALEEVRSKSWD
jgi:hypothetical protein